MPCTPSSPTRATSSIRAAAYVACTQIVAHGYWQSTTTNTSPQVLSRTLLVSKRQQEALKVNCITGELNLMTSQELDNYCVNDTFYLARGSIRLAEGDFPFWRDFHRGSSENSDKCPPPLSIFLHPPPTNAVGHPQTLLSDDDESSGSDEFYQPYGGPAPRRQLASRIW